MSLEFTASQGNSVTRKLSVKKRSGCLTIDDRATSTESTCRCHHLENVVCNLGWLSLQCLKSLSTLVTGLVNSIFLELTPVVEEPGFAGVGRPSLFVPHPVPL